MSAERVTALIAQARDYAREAYLQDSRMHGILVSLADALESFVPASQEPRVPGPNEPATYWHGAGCEEDDRG